MYSDEINLFESYVKSTKIENSTFKNKNNIFEVINNIESAIDNSIYCPNELKKKLEIYLSELKNLILK